MDEKQGGQNKETGQSPQAGETPTGQTPQESGSGAKTSDSSYQPGQGGKGGTGYQPGQSEMPGGTTSRPDPARGTDASES